MKKLLSVLIVAVMVLSTLSFVAPSGATAAQHTLDAHNVPIDVPYFSGTTNFVEITGASNKEKTFEDLGSINISDKTGSGELNLDGTITEAEWGKPIAEISRDYAAQMKGTEVSAENTYYWHVANGTQRYDETKNFSYKIWMAWDEDYLYIAAEVDDPDGAFANNPDGDIWNGDTLQFIVDPDGPNSIVNGEGYRADLNNFPWATAVRGGGSWKSSGKTANIGVGYLGSDGGVNMYDMAKRYNPHRVDVTDAAGNHDYWSTDWDSYDIFYKTFADDENKPANPLMGDKYAYAAVLPTSAATPENRLHTVTTYEVAVPWELMSGSYIEFDEETEVSTMNTVVPNPQAGDEYGFSVVMLNGGRGATEYNQWLTWGSGICGAQTENSGDFLTAGGSNSMVLVDTELGVGGCDHLTFSAPTCEQPYTCTACGYQKGFKTGHKYVSELVTPLGATMDGVIRSTCQTCGGVELITAEAGEQIVTAECPATPVVAPPLDPDSEWFTEGWNTIYKDERNNNAIQFNGDGSMKTSYKALNGEMVFDYSDSEAGTYFQTRNNRRSYSYKYSFKLTDTYATHFSNYVQDDNNNWVPETPSENYTQGLYHWFGGIEPNNGGTISYGISYAAGFFPDAPGATTGKFKIMEARGGVIIPSVREARGEDPQWVYCETDTIDLGTGWHDVIFVYDEDAGAAFYYLDGTCILAAADEALRMNGNDQVTIIRKMEVPCMIKDMAIGSTNAFLEDPEGFDVYLDGVFYGKYAEGETVTLPALENKQVNRKDARFYTWEGETVARGRFGSDDTSPTKRTYTMVMPGHDVELTSKFVLLGDVDGNNQLGVKDISQMKKVLSSSVTLTDMAKEAADVNLDGTTNSKDLGLLKKLCV